MPSWIAKLKRRRDEPAAAVAVVEAPTRVEQGEPTEALAAAWAPKATFEPAPEFATKLAVESRGAPGRAAAEAIYRKWADKWQEF